jgi:hypothetical protein
VRKLRLARLALISAGLLCLAVVVAASAVVLCGPGALLLAGAAAIAAGAAACATTKGPAAAADAAWKAAAVTVTVIVLVAGLAVMAGGTVAMIAALGSAVVAAAVLLLRAGPVGRPGRSAMHRSGCAWTDHRAPSRSCRRRRFRVSGGAPRWRAWISWTRGCVRRSSSVGRTSSTSSNDATPSASRGGWPTVHGRPAIRPGSCGTTGRPGPTRSAGSSEPQRSWDHPSRGPIEVTGVIEMVVVVVVAACTGCVRAASAAARCSLVARRGVALNSCS